MEDICVFLGPSLTLAEARATLDAVYLPPVRQGDVYRAALRYRPRAIGVIDGYFDQVPAVWHKEILWAMAQGIHVFGSASMGALRAAELAGFGMRGVGVIFEAYRSGVLMPFEGEDFEDDDEVAVVHGPPETGYVAVSEAMVNIRLSLAAAEQTGVIRAATRDAVAAIAKSLFYPQRRYQQVLARAAQQGLAAGELDALRAWLPAGGVNQKRLDALAMLAAMHDLGPEPMQVKYRFEHTTMWEAFLETVETTEGAVGDDTE